MKVKFAHNVSLVQRLGAFIRDYVRVRRSGLFDRAHYLAQFSDIQLKHQFALTHYLWSGERRGREPFHGFRPIIYLLKNEHLIPHGESPLAHYARTRPDSRALPVHPADVPALAEPVIAAGRPGETRQPIAIVCHIYFYHLWHEIAETLARLDVEFDLVCTVTDKPGFDDVLARILDFRPDAIVVKVSNRGRDILPFLWLTEQGWLAGYDAVCKIHTKKSIHRLDGDNWRRALIAPLLADGSRVRAVVDCLRADRALGLIAADVAFLYGDADWTENRDRARDICRRMVIDIDDHPLRFAAGSMYWLGSAAIAALAGLHLAAADFEPEEGQLDNTTAHAFERAFGVILQALKLEARGIDEILLPR